MLSTYLKRQQTLERYGSGPADPYLDGFTDWLEHQGYQPHRIQRLLRGVHQFSCWAHQSGVRLDGLTKDALASSGQHLQSRQRLRHPSGNHSYLFLGACHEKSRWVPHSLLWGGKRAARRAATISVWPTKQVPMPFMT